MRKQTKLVAVLAAAALLAIGASMTSFAAQAGWTEEDGTWVYLDKDGYKVTDTWKKSGNFWYYLDEDGYMATSKLIDNGDDAGNLYYVDETGRMVANRWVELENEDYYDSEDDNVSETNWYYFQNSGKAYKTSGKTAWKTINGKKYAFDDNGHMLYGWVNDNSERVTDGDSSYRLGIYYCGDANDGARVSNDWRLLYVGNDGPDRRDSEDDEYWFFFQINGEKVTNKTDKKINGKKYAFDEWGIMITDWHRATVETASELTGYYSEVAGGAQQKGWFKAVPSEKINPSDYNDDAEKWYFGNNNGTLVTSELKSISGKKYAFDEYGRMMSGLVAMTVDSDNKIVKYQKIDKESQMGDAYLETVMLGDSSEGVGGVGVYYFGGGEDGSMKTGNQTVGIDGDNYQFSFGKNGGKKGKGLNGLDNNAFYVYGKKIKADADYRYQAVDAEEGTDGVLYTDGQLYYGTDAVGKYLINTSGTLMKGTKYTDSEGRVYTLDDDHTIKSVTWK